MNTNNKFLISFFLLIIKISLSTCSSQLNLFQVLNKNNINNNILLSPISIYNILSLLSNGAKQTTSQELITTLQAPKKTKQNNIYKLLSQLNIDNKKILNIFNNFTSLEIANGIFSKINLLSSFKEYAEKYQATIEKLNSVEQINNWANEKTHGKIKTIINGLEPSTVLILLNAIYFKNKWLKQFEEIDTDKQYFYGIKNKNYINMMHQTDMFNYYEDDEIQIIELPYRKDFMKSLIFLPKNNTNINEYIEKLNDNKYKNYIKKLKFSKIKLSLPKFEINFGTSMKNVLKNMGINSAFESEEANFSGISDEKLFVSDVIHKVYLKVSESGTEAAAVTSVQIDNFSLRDDIVYEMNINRPFIFVIRNNDLPKNHDLIFIGKIQELE